MTTHGHILKEQARHKDKTSAKLRRVSEEIDQPRRRILVVDDEPDFASLVQANLEKEGFEVEVDVH